MKQPFALTLEVIGYPHLAEALLPELSSGKDNRSTVTLEKKKEGVLVTIEATDGAAMQASINSILKLIRVFEQAKGAIK